MASKGSGLLIRLIAWVLHRVRRSRFLPSHMLNRVADKNRLDQPLAGSVLVWFPTALDSMYQIRPWFRAFSALHDAHGLTIVCRDSRVARQIRSESGLDAISLGDSSQVEGILDASDISVALYVNLDPLDFDLLRFGRLTHVYIGHGDSDKSVFASNQVKAFDYYFVAGAAAQRRLARSLRNFDAESRCVLIGQPQLDMTTRPDPPRPDGRPVIVYAPTWEGAHRSASYSSLKSHGQELLRALIDHDAFRIVYRPHPLTGIEDPSFGSADRELRTLVSSAGHTVDTGNDLNEAFAGASLLITDISATVSYWLVTHRPLLLAVPDGVGIEPDSLASALPQIRRREASRIVEAVDTALRDGPGTQLDLEHYLGDTTPGAATERFIAAVSSLIEARN